MHLCIMASIYYHIINQFCTSRIMFLQKPKIWTISNKSTKKRILVILIGQSLSFIITSGSMTLLGFTAAIENIKTGTGPLPFMELLKIAREGETKDIFPKVRSPNGCYHALFINLPSCADIPTTRNLELVLPKFWWLSQPRPWNEYL